MVDTLSHNPQEVEEHSFSECSQPLSPEDLKVYTDEEAFWIEIKQSSEEDVQKLEKLIKMQKAIIEMCDLKLSLSK